MEICDDGHEVVCYESSAYGKTKCPVCDTQEDLGQQIEELQAKIDDLEKED